MPPSRPRAGLVLADSGWASEAEAYLQRRLTLFYGVILALAATLYVVGGILGTLAMGFTRTLVEPGRVVHLAALLGAGAVFVLLRRRRLPGRALVFLDALGLYISIGASVAIYALEYEYAPLSVPWILSLFVIARAVAVPSDAKTTLLLSAPAPVLILAVQLAYGRIYVDDGVLMSADAVVFHVVWTQVGLLLSVGVATLASRVSFGLRRQVREAARLGRYQIEERIGAGAMGEVYRARHAMLRRPTAIKVVRPDATDPGLLERFEREVRQTCRLTHPNTVAIFDYGTTPDGAFYYAMEYLDGKDLQTLVEATGPMPPGRVIHLLCQACGALQEAHGEGLVHRDIKPGNLVLCRRGGEHDVVKVVDFGLVKDLRAGAGSLTQVGQVCGTPETIAPEVLAGGAVTPAADLYALGVVGYYLLTGEHIFESSSGLEIIGHHLHTPPVPLAARRPDVPADLAAAIHRCLEKDPAARFRDAAALRAELARCADHGRWTEEAAAAWWRERAA